MLKVLIDLFSQCLVTGTEKMPVVRMVEFFVVNAF